MELELEPLNLPSDNERPFVIAGPCSAETEEQVMTTARELAMKGCHNFRAGVWKPRTKPGGFEGHGEPALEWLAQVKKETKMLVATEVATPEHVELCLKYGIDILWIGARTSANACTAKGLAVVRAPIQRMSMSYFSASSTCSGVATSVEMSMWVSSFTCFIQGSAFSP